MERTIETQSLLPWLDPGSSKIYLDVSLQIFGVQFYCMRRCMLCVERISDASQLAPRGSACRRIRGGVKAHAHFYHLCTGMKVGQSKHALDTHACVQIVQIVQTVSARLRLTQSDDVRRCLAQAESVYRLCVCAPEKISRPGYWFCMVAELV